MRGGPKPTLALAGLASGWIGAASRRRDGALALSPIAEELRLALQALRAGRNGSAGAAVRRATAPMRGAASAASSALRAAGRALAAGNGPAAEAAIARALLALV